jgi:hypothetical protein
VIVSAAVCPHPPGIVPALGGGIADGLSDVRTACLDAVAAMLAPEPSRVVIVGDGAATAWDETAGGSLAGFGQDVRAGGPDRVLPLSHTIGAWLLDEADWTGTRTYTPQWDDRTGRIAVLVMADGSSRHRRLAPEWTDVEGRAFDANVARALADGDADALASLELALADEIGASGIAGLVALGRNAKGARITSRLRYDGAPFGVGYWVADWQLS